MGKYVPKLYNMEYKCLIILELIYNSGIIISWETGFMKTGK